MVFLDADEAVIRHFYEKGYSAYRIWKENPDKKWDKSFVSRLIKRYVADGTMERIKGMVSAALTWHGVSKPIFVNRNGLGQELPRSSQKGTLSSNSKDLSTRRLEL